MIVKSLNKRGKRTVLKCLNCGEEFSELDIKIRAGKGKFCCNNCYKEYRKKNSMSEEELKQRNVEYQKKTKYGLDKVTYKNLLKQHPTCQICNKEFNEELKPFIDHDHSTGKVRGVLCTKCNSILGMANDNIEILQSAIQYLQYPSAPTDIKC